MLLCLRITSLPICEVYFSFVSLRTGPSHPSSYRLFCKGWFTLATESEAESEAQGALRSSVNQKTESEEESEARRNRSQKDQKSFFFFRFRFRRFRSSENRVNGIGSGIISQSKTHYQSLSNLQQEKNGGCRGKTGRGCETVPRSL